MGILNFLLLPWMEILMVMSVSMVTGTVVAMVQTQQP